MNNDFATTVTPQHIQERLCGISGLKQYLFENLSTPIGSQQNVWLAKGDFDSFRALNLIYGRKIIDLFIYTAGKTIIENLIEFELINNMNKIKFTLMGDDVLIVFPISWMEENDVFAILDYLRCCIEEKFKNKFIVACLTNFIDFIEGMSHSQIMRLEEDLSNQGIAIDFTCRMKGNLVLARTIKLGENPQEVLERVLYYLGKFIPFKPKKEIGICLDWIFNSHVGSFETLNNGFMVPVTISFGSVSENNTIKRLGFNRYLESGSCCQTNLTITLESMFEICEKNLKLSKKTGNCTTVNSSAINWDDQEIKKKINLKKSCCDFSGLEQSSVPTLREDELKGVLYESMETFHGGTLIHFIPFYLAKNESSLIDLSLFDKNELRGNEFGIGIKGVNNIFGNNAGDEIIRLLRSIIGDCIKNLTSQMHAGLNKIYLCRYVDQFRIFCEDGFLSSEQIIGFARSIVKEFNTRSEMTKISYLVISFVKSNQIKKADAFLDQLELTSISIECVKIRHSDDMLLVKEYDPQVEKEGRLIKENRAYQASLKFY